MNALIFTFILRVINQHKLCNFVALFVRLWPLGALLVGSLVPLTHYHHCFCLFSFPCLACSFLSFIFFSLSFLFSFFLALSYFLVLQDTSGSSCIFPSRSLRISHFSKEHWFNGQGYLKPRSGC